MTARATACFRIAAAVVALAAVLAGCRGPAPAENPGPSWAPEPRTVEGLQVAATSDAEGFRLHTASGDKTFLPGVNLGSTLPLHQPGEIDVLQAEDYRRWFGLMGDLGIRVVRVYTVHPPAFYDELAAYNEEHADAPLYLVQGAYLPDESYAEPGGTLYDPHVDAAFSEEIAAVSDAVHGDLSRPATPGLASGTWTTDVSAWVAGWLVGVEWDPAGVRRTDQRHAAAAYRPGAWFAATEDATATERWIAGHMDALAQLEAERGSAAPVALVNWSTTDPLPHPEEPLAYEDLVGVDANHVLPTAEWPAGSFASYHAYPYYPDFLRYEPGLREVERGGEPDPYAGYVAALRQHHEGTMPVMVTEFGVPASIGSAHLGTRGRDQGNHTEQEATAHDADLLRLIADQGLAGGFVFAWTDEWFKRTWNTLEHQVPERRQLWHDPYSSEEWFGLVATDPEPVVDAAAEVTPDEGPVEYAYVWADASFVHVETTFRDAVPDRFVLAADVLPGPLEDDHRVVVDTALGTARLEVRRGLDPLRLDALERRYGPEIGAPWHLYRLLLNHSLGGRPAELQDVGELVRGSWDPTADDYDSTATWQVDEERRTVRVRIPWPGLGFADPSTRTVLGEGDPAELVTVDGITLAIEVDGGRTPVELRWPGWNHTGHTERLLAGIDVLEQAYRDLAP